MFKMFLLISITLLFTLSVEAIQFSGYDWFPKINDDSVASTNPRIVLRGFSASTEKWYASADSCAYIGNDGFLHLRFYKRNNPYYIDTTQVPPVGDSIHLYNVVLQHRDCYRSLFDYRAGWWQKFLEGMKDSIIWFQSDLASLDTFRYGSLGTEL